jgi:hypothetical protein
MVGGGKGGCGGCEAKVAMDLRGKGRGWVRLVTNYMESSQRRKCWEMGMALCCEIPATKGKGTATGHKVCCETPATFASFAVLY